MQTDILIVSNGPGELASWVHPIVSQLKLTAPTSRVVVALVPCPYASGNEADTLAGWPEPVGVWHPKETMRYLLGGPAPAGYRPAGRGVVLFLGGDQLFGVLLARRTGFPLVAYTETDARWTAFTRYFLASDRTTFLRLRNRGVKPSQLRLVGNLMVDSVSAPTDSTSARQALRLRPDAMVLGLLPGSKPFKVRYVTPLFLRVAEILQRDRPGLQIVLLRSPFTPREQLHEAVTNERYREATGGVVGRVEREGTWDWIVTAGGARIQVLPPEAHAEALSVLDLALTVPGTNTAELAVGGVPMVVALPLHKPEVIPLDGLIGQLGSIPVLGPAFKRFLARRFAARKPLLALPNQRAGLMVTPELMGVFPPESLALAIENLLADGALRRDIKLKLHAIMGPAGAARAVVEILMEILSRRVASAPPLDSEAAHPSEPTP